MYNNYFTGSAGQKVSSNVNNDNDNYFQCLICIEVDYETNRVKKAGKSTFTISVDQDKK